MGEMPTYVTPSVTLVTRRDPELLDAADLCLKTGAKALRGVATGAMPAARFVAHRMSWRSLRPSERHGSSQV